jgi:hypothetical protein
MAYRALAVGLSPLGSPPQGGLSVSRAYPPRVGRCAELGAGLLRNGLASVKILAEALGVGIQQL